MSDKSKIDESVYLTVNTEDAGGVTSTTTIEAEDAVALAAILKNAGVRADDYNGSATLMAEITTPEGGRINQTIQAPSLRAIMQMIEPEFAAAGDQGAEAPAEDPAMAAARAQAHSDIDHEFNQGNVAGAEIYDPGCDPYDIDGLDGLGDMEPGAPVLDTGARSQFSVAEPQMSADNVPVDRGMADNTLDVEVDANGNLAIVNDEEPVEELVGEDADYDFRTHDVHPQEYAGRGDKKVVQPKTKVVPARSGDDPIVEAVGGDHQFSTGIEYNGQDIEVQVYYAADSGEFATGLDYPSTASHGLSIDVTSVVDSSTGEDILAFLSPEEHQRLEQEAIDDYHDSGVDEAYDPNASFPDTEQGAIDALNMWSNLGGRLKGATAKPDPVVAGVWLVTYQGGRSIVYLNQRDFEEVDEAQKPKRFADYVREAELNELSRANIRGYVDRVNQDDHEDANDERLGRRWRGLNNAQSKIYWKDAKVLATESAEDLLKEFQLNELSGDAKSAYIQKALANKAHHEKKASDLEDLAWDARDAEKRGTIRQGASARVDRERNRHDSIARKREKGLDRLGATGDEHEVDEAVVDEAGRGYDDYDRKRRQYGPAFYLNTDCGFASLNDLGTHDYFHGGGVVILEIDRNGKKGLNYVAGHDNTKPGTSVTVITATSTGQKYRPGKVIDSFTFDEYEHDREGLEKRLAQYGITPTKKLSVKTFD